MAYYEAALNVWALDVLGVLYEGLFWYGVFAFAAIGVGAMLDWRSASR